jgi:DNA mismatch repair protein MutS2
MQYFPSDFLSSLEFDKIIDLLIDNCTCQVNKEALRNFQFITDSLVLQRKLNEVDELTRAIGVNRIFFVSDFEDIKLVLPLLLKQDYVLEIEQLLNLKNIISQVDDLMNYCTEVQCVGFPLHTSRITSLPFDQNLDQAFKNIFNEDNSIREDASPELKSIFSLIRSKERELDRKFESLLQSFKAKAWLSDSAESYKNGRRVLSVMAENKRKIKGIIHDESATGKTIFIEPDGIIEINNDLFELHNEKKKELYKVFRDLCNFLSSYTDDLKNYQDLLVELDLSKAKARLAVTLNAVKPKIADRPFISLKTAFHPLLFVKNRREDKPVVPFDLVLDKNRILLLSGPNAGGKSITMKATGLIQMMFQFGLMVPAKEAELGIFQRILGDIGDHQSLEDDLSTYSSRLQNMKYFINNAKENSLVLIDEFGSGTDPKIGGAIAEAILNGLLMNKCFGVITTHYSNLKIFAYKAKNMVNGAMIFDEEGMKPTFQMRVGRPGSSFAFEIANKIGMPEKIIKSAKDRAGGNVKAIDQLLVDLQREKKELEDKIDELNSKQGTLDRLVKNYEILHKELEIRRKRLKLAMKETAINSASEQNKEMDRFIKKIAEINDEKKARAEAKKMKENLRSLQDQSKKLREDLFYAEEIDVSEIKEGSFVKMRSSETMGQVIAVKKNKVELIVGDMKMIVPLTELRPAKELIDVKTKKSINLTVTSDAKVHSKLDVRGFRKSEALLIIEDFLDKALINNLSMLEIIHGKGNGILRSIVHQKLKEYADIKKFWHPEENDGLTLIEL